MNDDAFRPGCFGAATCFNATSAECKSCSFIDACEPVAITRLKELRNLLGIPEPVAKTRGRKPKVAPQTISQAPSKDVFKDAVAQNKNIFMRKGAEYAVFWKIVFLQKKPINRKMLTRALSIVLKNNGSSVETLADNAIAYFLRLKIVSERNGLFCADLD